MKKSSVLFLAGIGLVLITTGRVSAQGDNLHPLSGTAPRIFSNRTDLSDVSHGSSGNPRLEGANSQPSSRMTVTLNSSLAILTGVLTLRLLQRRNRADIASTPRH